MGQQERDIKLIFAEALEKQTAEERLAYLDSTCGNDAEMLRKVEALLTAYEAADDVPDGPLVDLGPTMEDLTIVEQAGTTIGRYKLLEKIGEGGMAVVYMAEQEKPIRRKVALKIIKLGMDTRTVIARFEAERQALAMMDHPNIAKVLDAGATETGRPYFVMELVTGVSITEYCDKNNLNTKERLKLFIEVCNAVQHAHQKGIIHRDIKPSNVMVTHQDGKPVPKVIDFGIAKATNQKLTEKTLFTRYAHIIGTPAYMSPEQADLGDLDVDTRSDIYSLGVLLYELLTGTTPFSEEELRNAGYLEIQRIIQEQEPPKPSTKLSTLGGTLTDIAKYRASTPDLLTKIISGDIDWIVMKSLEKARDRRYDTVSSLALDIQRHLDDQPILARAPGTFYLVRKFLRRHRRWSTAAAVITLLFFAVVVMSLMLNHAHNKFVKIQVSRDKDILTQAHTFIDNKDLKRALESLEKIIPSPYVGVEARTLSDQILRDIQRELRSYTDKIEGDSDDPIDYLRRVQYSYCLDDMKAVLSDMESYLSMLYPMSEESSKDRRLKDFLTNLWTSTPTNLGPSINTSLHEWAPCISNDGLSLLFNSNRPCEATSRELWISSRLTLTDPWNTATPLGPPADGQHWAGSAVFSSDGLSLYLVWKRTSWDICVSTRAKIEDNWGAPVDLGPTVNSEADDFGPTISADGQELFFTSNRSDSFEYVDDIYVSTRQAGDSWGKPVNLGSIVNSHDTDGFPSISADGLLLFFSSFRHGTFGSADLYVTTRATKGDDWGPPVNLGPTINSPYEEACCCISADGSTLYFSSRRPGGYGGNDLWQVSIARQPGIVQKENHTDSNRISNEDGNDGKEVAPKKSNLSDVSIEEE